MPSEIPTALAIRHLDYDGQIPEAVPDSAVWKPGTRTEVEHTTWRWGPVKVLFQTSLSMRDSVISTQVLFSCN